MPLSRVFIAAVLAILFGITVAARAQPDANSAPPDAGFVAPDAGSASVDADPGPDGAPDAAHLELSPLPPEIPVIMVLPPPEAAPPAPIEGSEERTLFALKVIGGLAALMVLAYLGGHPRVVRFEARLGISSVVAAGFPFVALGLVASHPSVGILDGYVLDQLKPLMHFGLGWLGFLIGSQLDIRVLDRLPRGSGYLIVVEALAPFAITATACGAVMLGFGISFRDPTFWRNAILLGTAAAMTAPRLAHGFANRGWVQGRGVDVLMAQLDEIVGVVGLVFITAYFREPGLGAWQLPSTAWLFVSIGIGVVIGLLIFVMVRVPKSSAEFLAIVLGGIAFASGLAGYLRLSPIVVCFLAGVLVVNFPCEQRDSVFRILTHLERPVHLLFLVIAGAVWSVSDWRGWLLVPVFVAARILGKWAGITAARTALGADLPPGFADHRRLVSPMSALAIALVISIQSNYSDPALAWIITAVIGAAIVSELLVQLTPAPAAPQVAAAVDEADR